MIPTQRPSKEPTRIPTVFATISPTAKTAVKSGLPPAAVAGLTVGLMSLAALVLTLFCCFVPQACFGEGAETEKDPLSKYVVVQQFSS